MPGLTQLVSQRGESGSVKSSMTTLYSSSSRRATLLSRLPTFEKLRSRSSENMGSLSVASRCLRFFSFASAGADGAEAAAVGGAEGFVGALTRDEGTSMCAAMNHAQDTLGALEPMNAQFLTPITSSMSPSYVNWVSSGVTMSTLLSRTIRQSNWSDRTSWSSEPSFAAWLRA